MAIPPNTSPNRVIPHLTAYRRYILVLLGGVQVNPAQNNDYDLSKVTSHIT